MKAVRRIHLSINTFQAHWQRILEGVSFFATTQKRPWQLSRDWGTSLTEASDLGLYQGAILQSHKTDLFVLLHRLKIPCVVTGSAVDPETSWAVLPDSKAIGRLAAEHFLEKGFQNFAFFGTDKHWYSQERFTGYSAHLKPHKIQTYSSVDHNQAEITEWLKSLRAGTALFCANDTFARGAANCLAQIGRSVPEEIALLGVDNDQVESALSATPLSSIDPRSRETGIEAARFLDELIRGKHPRKTLRLIPPGGILTRRSSDLIAVEDQTVSKALSVIRDQACTGLQVEDVLRLVPLSRRTMERRFKEVTGRGIEEEIRRVRLGRAKELLARTGLTIGEVAERAGFSDIFYFSAVFRKTQGSTPTTWRKNHSTR